MKRPPRQVRLEQETDAEIKKIAEVTDLPEIEVIRQAVKAGVRAIKENGYKLPLPLQLRVVPAGETAEARYPSHREEIARTEDKPSSSPGRALAHRTFRKLLDKHKAKPAGPESPQP